MTLVGMPLVLNGVSRNTTSPLIDVGVRDAACLRPWAGATRRAVAVDAEGVLPVVGDVRYVVVDRWRRVTRSPAAPSYGSPWRWTIFHSPLSRRRTVVTRNE
jgi:hypothetical protein